MVKSIEADPWGLPYRLVIRKLKGSASALTESMPPAVLKAVLDSLFADGDVVEAPTDRGAGHWEEHMTVTPRELFRVIKGRVIKNTAPGPDGIQATIWRRVPESVIQSLGRCFSVCLREGSFPTKWKRAKLALIPKGPGVVGGQTLPDVRPICLLDDVGKILERIIAERIDTWMEENPRDALSDNQYGFRRGRSTWDALSRIKNEVQGVVENGGVAIAVSLDVANAFNSLPWHKIHEALSKKSFPDYIRQIIRGYLSERWIEFTVAEGKIRDRAVRAGVPQGSVLGPLLWNLTHDHVLRTPTIEDCSIIGYADDTLILATADSVEQANRNANLQTAWVVKRVVELGLDVAAKKTRAILFHGPRRKPREMPVIRVQDTIIIAGDQMKHFGIILDSRWKFHHHLEHAASKASRVARAVGRLMSNLRGPQEPRRKLYASAVLSVILYGAPLWSEAIASQATASLHKTQVPLNRVQRFLAHRIIAAYRTVSLETVIVLAGLPPLRLMANMQKRVYDQVRTLRSNNNWTPDTDKEVRRHELSLLRCKWKVHLQGEGLSGERVRKAILPIFNEWLRRKYGDVRKDDLSPFTTGNGARLPWRVPI